MDLFPQLGLYWTGGWILLVAFLLVFGGMVLLSPGETRVRLYDRSGWTRTQQILTRVGKVLSLACLILQVLSPLKAGEGVFYVGMALFVLGLAGLVVALYQFRDTPAGQPVTGGLYRVSRNPQWVMLVLIFVGTCLAIGSWVALLLMSAAVVVFHYRILAEERSCLALYGASYREYMQRVPRYLLFF